MRILNRPMFRYGGPIKEGVMHGMRNGGRAALVGNPVYPQTGGREHHKISMLNPMNWKNMFVGANVAKNPTIGSKAWQGIKSIFGKSTPATGELYKTPFKPSSFNVHPYWARDPTVKSALWAKKALTSPGAKNIGEKIVQGIASPTGIGLTLVGTKWLWPDGKEANKVEIEEHLNTGGNEKWSPGVGGEQYDPSTSPSALAAKAKADRKIRLDKYLDTMGYDKAKKTAMGDALIDASAIVQQGTEEGGSLKHADWGKMINKAIQSTSKRLDKPEQIREAVGLMMTKTDIEKEASAEEDALKKIATKLQIKGLQKTLAGETLQESINAAYQRTGKFPTGSTLAGVARTKGIEVTSVIPTKDIPDDMSAIDYISIITEKAKKDGNPMPKGHYVIKDRLVEIDESGDIIKQLI